MASSAAAPGLAGPAGSTGLAGAGNDVAAPFDSVLLAALSSGATPDTSGPAITGTALAGMQVYADSTTTPDREPPAGTGAVPTDLAMLLALPTAIEGMLAGPGDAPAATDPPHDVTAEPTMGRRALRTIPGIGSLRNTSAHDSTLPDDPATESASGAPGMPAPEPIGTLPAGSTLPTDSAARSPGTGHAPGTDPKILTDYEISPLQLPQNTTYAAMPPLVPQEPTGTLTTTAPASERSPDAPATTARPSALKRLPTAAEAQASRDDARAPVLAATPAPTLPAAVAAAPEPHGGRHTVATSPFPAGDALLALTTGHDIPPAHLALTDPTAGAAAPERIIRLSHAPTAPAWRGELIDSVRILVSDRVQSAALQLNPAEMGPVSISITIAEQQASIAFAASHDDTRRAIEQALPQLRDMLAGSGIALGNATVADQPQHEASRGEPPTRPQDRKGGDEDTAGQAQRPVRISRHLIDTFA